MDTKINTLQDQVTYQYLFMYCHYFSHWIIITFYKKKVWWHDWWGVQEIYLTFVTCHLNCSQHTLWIHTNMNAWKIKSTYMSSHRHPSDTKRSQPVAFTPVKQNQRLQNKATTHHKDVWHIVQTWTAFKRYKSKKCLSP